MQKSLLAVAVALASATGANAVNLVTNGSFETVAPGSPASFELGPNYLYSGNLTGWTSTAGSPTNTNSAFNLLFDSATATTVDASTRFTASEPQKIAFENYGGASPDGGNFVALDGDTAFNGYLTQSISGLTIGKAYRLTFYWAGTQLSNRTGDTTERLEVAFGGDGFTTATIGGPTHYFAGWYGVTHDFVATSGTQLLSFLSIGTPNGLPPVALLDGVSLSVVPEPATWGLMLAGFGLAGIAARRRARGSVAA